MLSLRETTEREISPSEAPVIEADVTSSHPDYDDTFSAVHYMGHRQVISHENAVRTESNVAVCVPHRLSTITLPSKRYMDELLLSNGCRIIIPTVRASETDGNSTRITMFSTGARRLLDFYSRLVFCNSMVEEISINPVNRRNFDLNSNETTGLTNCSRDELEDDVDSLSCVPDPPSVQNIRHRDSGYSRDVANCMIIRQNDDYSRLTNSILTKFEIKSAVEGTCRSDVAVSTKSRDMRASMMSILPATSSSACQIVLLFGGKRWRQGRSMRLCSIRISAIMSQESESIRDDNTIVLNCSCAEFGLTEKCNHSNIVLNKDTIRMRVVSVMKRRLRSALR